jgi:rhodanese-related sulfurtransferase
VPEEPRTVPVDQVPQGAVLLDVREDDEFAAGHAPGALHVPLGEVPARAGELPEDEVFVLCRAGGRATRAAQWLQANGYDAVVVEGGTGAWVEAGRPLVAEGGGQPQLL